PGPRASPWIRQAASHKVQRRRLWFARVLLREADLRFHIAHVNTRNPGPKRGLPPTQNFRAQNSLLLNPFRLRRIKIDSLFRGNWSGDKARCLATSKYRSPERIRQIRAFRHWGNWRHVDCSASKPSMSARFFWTRYKRTC